MTFSLGASGTVQEVKNTLIQQAQQYTSEAAGHVVDLLHKVVDILDAPHGVSVSASGHGNANSFSASISASPLSPPSPDSTPEPTTGPVS